MKILHFESKTTLQFDAPVVNHSFLLRYVPPEFDGQRIERATLRLSPAVPYTLFTDGFGNLNETGCVRFEHTEFIYEVSGTAIVSEAGRMRTPLCPIYKYPSHFTVPTQAMRDYVQELHLHGRTLDMAVQLADAVYNYIEYTPGATNTQTTAAQVFKLKKGVCQDFAHLFIAMSRLADIPARYANGLPLGDGQSHAWCEVYANGIWVGVDPTRNRLVGEDYVRFCTGRDFLDCSLERGVLFGDANQSQSTLMQVTEQ